MNPEPVPKPKRRKKTKSKIRRRRKCKDFADKWRRVAYRVAQEEDLFALRAQFRKHEPVLSTEVLLEQPSLWQVSLAHEYVFLERDERIWGRVPEVRRPFPERVTRRGIGFTVGAQIPDELWQNWRPPPDLWPPVTGVVDT